MPPGYGWRARVSTREVPHKLIVLDDPAIQQILCPSCRAHHRALDPYNGWRTARFVRDDRGSLLDSLGGIE